MEVLFIWYPKCTTCQKAKKYLDDKNIKYIERHIVENNPTIKELTKWIKISGKEANKFFNTSGMLYRQMELTKKLPSMSEEEKQLLKIFCFFYENNKNMSTIVEGIGMTMKKK